MLDFKCIYDQLQINRDLGIGINGVIFPIQPVEEWRRTIINSIRVRSILRWWQKELRAFPDLYNSDPQLYSFRPKHIERLQIHWICRSAIKRGMRDQLLYGTTPMTANLFPIYQYFILLFNLPHYKKMNLNTRDFLWLQQKLEHSPKHLEFIDKLYTEAYNKRIATERRAVFDWFLNIKNQLPLMLPNVRAIVVLTSKERRHLARRYSWPFESILVKGSVLKRKKLIIRLLNFLKIIYQIFKKK